MDDYRNPRSLRMPARYVLLGAVIALVLLISVLAALTTPGGGQGPALIGG